MQINSNVTWISEVTEEGKVHFREIQNKISALKSVENVSRVPDEMKS